MRRLVECVPNFSDGRDPAKLDAIVAAIRAVPGAYVLDRTSDADHNRSVITMAGEPDAVREAAVRAAGKAAELIDLTQQTGAHPRIGATDVVPFVPVEGVTIEDCVALAKQAAREIWERFHIPVYLYEAAAQRPERINLENIRRGQFEGLREEVLRNPDRAPDVGEARLHPTAGATVVGARKFLIAYNINLDTSDVSIAKAIAKKIRFSSGGLPCVKAMGVDLRGRNLAQVSMNLTDFETTPVHRVFEEVKREAQSLGAGIAGSEIIGLIPKRAIEMTADYFLKIENFSPRMVLENRLEESLRKAERKKTETLAGIVQPFLDAVARPKPAPGGGSVAALAGALAASLGQMVAGISREKKSLAPHASLLTEAAAEFQAASRALADAIDSDAAAFEAVMAAYHLPKGTPDEAQRRERAVQQALARAVEVPLHVARKAAMVFERLRQLESMSGPSMLSDVRVGRLMAAAAARGALDNVAINLKSITDAAFVKRVQQEAGALASRIVEGSAPAGR
ncbi:MAG TPA: glutamate formimidoyltransferase [Candidatus Acidoferrum sp.]|nr:glutamate formimidoyltransferase [Candidatus Acidoferrum sp.]